eukprot:1945301-Amphidinium_carterae.1
MGAWASTSNTGYTRPFKQNAAELPFVGKSEHQSHFRISASLIKALLPKCLPFIVWFLPGSSDEWIGQGILRMQMQMDQLRYKNPPFKTQ